MNQAIRPATPWERFTQWVSWNLRGLLAVAIFSGCGLPPLRVLRYHDRDIIIARPEIVDAFCSDTAGKWDDGTPRAKGASVGGCYQKNPTLWMKDPPNAGTYFHENRHHDCAKYSKNPDCGLDPQKEGYK